MQDLENKYAILGRNRQIKFGALQIEWRLVYDYGNLHKLAKHA